MMHSHAPSFHLVLLPFGDTQTPLGFQWKM